MSEETEPVLRRIMELRRRIDARKEIIDYLETVQMVKRSETTLSHEELMIADKIYQSDQYTIRALKGWQTRNQREIDELTKLHPPPPPYKYIQLSVTFSIDTNEGHEPMFAEVTCQTLMSTGARIEVIKRRAHRIVNAAIKLFFMLFDAFKCLKKTNRAFWGEDIYDPLIKGAIWIQKYAEIVEEQFMDNTLLAFKELDCFDRPIDEFSTRKAIIKIGLEYHYATKEMAPEYPTIFALIEKGTSAEATGDWIVERKIQLSHKTDVSILQLLDIGVEWE